MKAKFYICNHCGNLVTTIHNAGVPLVCCGEKMKELVPNTVEASGEKHLPVAELSGSRLTSQWARWSTPWRMFTIFSGFLWRLRTAGRSAI